MPTLQTETNIVLRWRVGKRFTKLMAPENLAGIEILITDKVDLKPKLHRWDKVSHFILIKEIMHQDELTTVSLYVYNVSTPNFIKYTLLDLKHK
jgi:hypothetical protein